MRGRVVLLCCAATLLTPGSNASAAAAAVCPLQADLRFGLDTRSEHNWVCCNKEHAEPKHMFRKHLQLGNLRAEGKWFFYDSKCGLPLFHTAGSREHDDWWDESVGHGWPSFREDEIIAENLVIDKAGPKGFQEVRSTCGTHLGHLMPDRRGPRYCINLLCIGGKPSIDAGEL